MMPKTSSTACWSLTNNTASLSTMFSDTPGLRSVGMGGLGKVWSCVWVFGEVEWGWEKGEV